MVGQFRCFIKNIHDQLSNDIPIILNGQLSCLNSKFELLVTVPQYVLTTSKPIVMRIRLKKQCCSFRIFFKS